MGETVDRGGLWIRFRGGLQLLSIHKNKDRL